MKVREKLRTVTKRIRASRFLWRMALGYVLILAFVFAGAVLFFHHINAQTQADLLSQSQADLAEKGAKLDAALEDIHTSDILLLQNSMVRSSVKPYDTLTAQDRKNLEFVIATLGDLTLRHDLVECSFLYIEKRSVYTDSAMYDWELFFKKCHIYGHYEPPMQTDHPISYVFNLSGATSLKQADGREMLVFPVSICDRTTGMVLIQDLRVSRLCDLLLNFSGDFQHFFIRYQESLISASGEDVRLLEEALETPDRYAVHRYGGTFGIELYCVNDLSAITLQVNKRYEVLTYIFLLIAAMMVFLAAAVCFYVYKPVRRLKQVVQTDKQKNENSEKPRETELDTFARAYTDIWDRYGTAQRELNAVSDRYRLSCLESLLFFNSFPSRTSEQLRIENLLGLNGMEIACLCVEFDLPDDTLPAEEPLITLFEHIATLCSIHCLLFPWSEQARIAVISSSTLTEKNSLLFGKRVLEAFKTEFRAKKVHIGIGSPVRHLSDLRQSFRQAETACAWMIGDFDCAAYPEQEEIQSDRKNVWPALDPLCNLIRAGDQPRAEKTMAERNTWMMQTHVSAAEARSHLFSFYKQLCTLPVTDETLKSRLTASRDALECGSYGLGCTVRQYIAWVDSIAAEVCAYFFQKENSTESRVAEVTAYIHTHYKENLGLAELSDAFGYSAGHLSRIFKEGVGETISDYIARIRIGQACQLLVNTEDPVQEISENVGIYSRSTFLRLFRNITGVSPSEYRKAHKTGA